MHSQLQSKIKNGLTNKLKQITKIYEAQDHSEPIQWVKYVTLIQRVKVVADGGGHGYILFFVFFLLKGLLLRHLLLSSRVDELICYGKTKKQKKQKQNITITACNLWLEATKMRCWCCCCKEVCLGGLLAENYIPLFWCKRSYRQPTCCWWYTVVILHRLSVHVIIFKILRGKKNTHTSYHSKWSITNVAVCKGCIPAATCLVISYFY